MERDAAKALPKEQLLEILSTVPSQSVDKIATKKENDNEKVALYKTLSTKSKMIETLEKSLANAKQSNNESMIEILTKKIEEGVNVPDVAAKAVTDTDIAQAYIDTIVTARPVANFFGGDIMEPVFDWLYYTADWNVNLYGNQFAQGMYSCLLYTSPSQRD